MAGVTIKFDQGALDSLMQAAGRAAKKTMDALKTEVVTAQVMPFDVGVMQNTATFVNADETGAQLVTDTPYARRLYHHPEYNFQTVNNPNAGGLWLEPWLTGDRKDFVRDTFAEQLKKEAGI